MLTRVLSWSKIDKNMVTYGHYHRFFGREISCARNHFRVLVQMGNIKSLFMILVLLEIKNPTILNEFWLFF